MGNRTEGSGRISPVDSFILENKSNSTGSDFNSDGISSSFSNENSDDTTSQIKLKATTSHRGIIEAMCSQNTEFSFIKSE